jgi:integrase
MANIKLILDKRRMMRDNLYPVRLYIYHRGKEFRLSTGVNTSADSWDDRAGMIIGRDTTTKAKNARLRDMLNRCEALQLNLSISGELQKLTAKEFKQRVEHELCLQPVKHAATLYDYLEKAKTGKAERTVRLFTWAQARVEEFCGKDKGVADIDEEWMVAFRDDLLERYAPNTVAQGMAWVSRALSIAVTDGVIRRNPASGIKKPSAPTRKRAVTVEVLRQLRDMTPTPPMESYARDVFLLQFYLRGINIVDLRDLTEITDGRIEYVRHKTGTLYSVKVEPEAMAIIERLRSETHLVDMSRFSSAGTACSAITQALKRIIPGLSTNAARHTWATLAAELEIPMEATSHALGHKIGSPITAIYIAYNQKKVDDANRKVIDYLNADLFGKGKKGKKGKKKAKDKK